MKNQEIKLTLTLSFLLLSMNLRAQNAPVWTRDINTLPDSAALFPLRTIHDGNNSVYVLSTYHKTFLTGGLKNKIQLYKYDSSGGLIWSLIYDNNGIGEPRGFDMAVDNAGNCYIAGGWMATANFKPLLIKVNSSGNVSWSRDSTTAFNTGRYDQAILYNNKLYLKGDKGLAQFDLNGNEQWSNQFITPRIAVDHLGQVIFSMYVGNPNTIFRCDSNGVLNFNAASIYADRIAIDQDNSFYLLNSTMQYSLVKFDSAGIQQWSYSSFPLTPPFGDYACEVLCDYNNDVIVTGLADTMYKFSSTGVLKWVKPMMGLDSYNITAQITFNNVLAISGSVPGGNGFNMQVGLYDLMGNESWMGQYSGNDSLSEFSVDMTLGNDGIYVVENNNQNTTLAKFQNPLTAFDSVNYNLVCVDSVWYEPGNNKLINVRVFNGDLNNLNYPSVQIVSPAGDTVGNPHNFVNFFAQLGNAFTVYTDSITDSTLTSFSNYTFLINEGFGDTTAVIHWCGSMGISEIESDQLFVYPNPASDFIQIVNPFLNRNAELKIYNTIGEVVLKKTFPGSADEKINVSSLAPGLYIITLCNNTNAYRSRMLKQ